MKELVELRDGILYWRERIGVRRNWNTRYAGKPIRLNPNASGHLHFPIDHAHLFLAHRVIWLLRYGSWPQNQIDHINGDPSDNRIENLRDVDQQENSKNKARSRRNTSGTSGVYWDASCAKWRAVIRVNKKHIPLGAYHDKAAAVAVRLEAQREYGFSERHGCGS